MRGDGVVEDVDGVCPPQDGRVVGDDGDDDFPLLEGSCPGRITPPGELPSRTGKSKSSSSPKTLSSLGGQHPSTSSTALSTLKL